MSNFFHTPSDTISSLPSDVQGLGQSFSKEALRNGQFIAQVDRKFLLVRLDASSRTETLVMIDQHAADERCRVERFLDQTCGNVARGEPIEVCTFTPPIAVVVSVEEAREMKERTEQYSTWAIGLDWSDRDVKEEGGQDYAQVYVTTVPLLVSDRLRVEPALLQALLRSYLAQLLERPRKDDSRRSTSDSWSSTMRDCPPVLLELINSKACRGAIVFNDELSSQQCTTLVARLAETNFPFQCAHGRPSLVPIVNLARVPTKTVTPARGIDWRRLES
jgi:DNA mismatch repair protein MLH3